jgi:putative transposase
VLLTYRYKLKDRSAKKHLRQHAYAVNQVWNYCAGQQRDTESRYKAGAKPRRWASHFDLQKLCKGVGRELGLHQQSVSAVCRTFAQARDKLKHAPRFRSSFGSKRALGWIPFESQSRQHDGKSITYLGKTYRLFGVGKRPIPETAKGGIFSEDSQGRWWVCFHVEVSDRVVTGSCEVGIDLGLKDLATLSDGTKVRNPRHVQKWARKLASAQRARNKRRVKVIHAKIANARRDHLHKLTTRLSRDYAFIAVGNVNSSRLARTRMAKSVLDAGWSTFRAMLRYKSPGCVEVDERFTTQTCSQCGALSGPKGIAGLGMRFWECSECGTRHSRDVNSARIILEIGCSAVLERKPDTTSRSGDVAPPVGGSWMTHTTTTYCGRMCQPDKHELISVNGCGK